MKVVIAVIFDEEQRILITQRPPHATHGGMWEFPGGKIEDNEMALDALIREVKEEVGLDVLQAEFLTQIQYTYPHHCVELLVYRIDAFSGEATCCEQQTDLRWVKQALLQQFEFPEANQHIIERLAAS